VGISVSRMAQFAAAVTSMPPEQLESVTNAFKHRLKEDDRKEVHKYAMGDRLVYVDDAGKEHIGVVDKLNARTVRVRNENGELIRVPKDDIRGRKATSEKSNEWVEIRS
jgi:hypothetical protein